MSPSAMGEKLNQTIADFRLPAWGRSLLPPVLVERMSWMRAQLLSRGLPRDRSFEQPLEHRSASASMSIIVPIHDAPFVTLRCLASLERYASEAEIMLVDDASRLAETTNIIREFSDRNGWKVLCNRTALGHSGACMAGADLSTRPYLCLLNSDTVVTPWCWLGIEKAFQSDPQIAVVGPCTSDSGRNRQTIDRAAHCKFHWNDSQICAFAQALLLAPPEPIIIDLPMVTGFAFFIRRALWQELNGFDANLPDYGNEEDLCNRITRLGYRVVCVRNSYIHHLGEQTYGKKISSDELQLRRLSAEKYIRTKQQHLKSETH